jgi:glycosyltransferase involved in cell wall biosynthesis
MLGTMKADVTICTATIPIRSELLQRCIASVANQTLQPEKHLIMVDEKREGHTVILDRMIEKATTKYIAILDDDDELLPRHIEAIYNCIEETNADLVFPWFKYSNLPDGGHLEKYRNQPWDNNQPRQVPITWIAKRETILSVGGFQKDFDINSYIVDKEGNREGQDFAMIKKLCAIDAKIVHHPEVTWIYHVGHGSTLGMPVKW